MIAFLKKHKTLFEIVRFVIVGGIATVIDFLVFSLIIYLFNMEAYAYSFFAVLKSDANATTFSVVLGTGLGFSISLFFNYLLSVLFVFENKGNSKSVKGFLTFAALSLIGLVIHTVFMYVGYDLLHFNEFIIKIVLTLVVMVFNYVTRKKIIFKQDKSFDQSNVSNEKVSGE